MSNRHSLASDSSVVQIVGPDDQWILEKLARKLVAKLPYAEFVPWKPRLRPTTRLVYYVNYALFREPSGAIDVGYFTHLDPENDFLERARQMDLCISMSRLYADWLIAQGIQHVIHIPMGFDAYRYRPRLILGVVGLLDHPRKGKHLIEQLKSLPFVEILATEGRIAESEIRDFYQKLDFVLIPSTVEGGPMCLLEALSMGKPVIAPDGVGMVPEFVGHNQVRRYTAGDAGSLEAVVGDCFAAKLESSQVVAGRSWDDWAEAHHRVFMELLKARGFPPVMAAPGFRFGLMSQLELRWDTDCEPIEAVVDEASAHLFYGRREAAKHVLTEAAKTFPCTSRLLEEITGTSEHSHPVPSPRPCGERVRVRRFLLPKQSAATKGHLSGSASEGSSRSLQCRDDAQVDATRERLTDSEPDDAARQKKPRILLIAHVGTLRDRMDKSHYYRYEALSKRPNVKLFGPGLPGNRAGMSLDEAIQATFGEDPDLVIHGGDLRDTGIPLVTGLESATVPTAIELLDTWANPHLTLDFIHRHRFRIALMQESGYHMAFFRQHCPQTAFYWTPNAVNTELFRDYGSEKEYDVIFYGVLEPVIYPLRTRLARLLSNQTDMKVKIIRHPGYDPVRPTEAHSALIGAELSREINKSWIGIATRSVYNCLLMKYLEIAASGTAILGNIPDSGRDLLSDCMFEINDEMPDQAIIVTLKNALADKDRLREMIQTSSRRVIAEFSTEVFADHIVQMAVATRDRSLSR